MKLANTMNTVRLCTISTISTMNMNKIRYIKKEILNK